MSDIAQMYLSGMSTRDIAKEIGESYSAVRRALVAAGVMRQHADAVKLSGAQGKSSRGRLGKKFPHKAESKEKMRAAKLLLGEKTARGVRLTTTGYLEYTRGPHKGRNVHSVVIEQKIGRKLLPHECAHHVDHNKLNNSPDNLVVMTRSAHASHHRKEKPHGFA